MRVIACDGTGANGTEITFTFDENYYQLQEIFKVEETEDQFMVVANPVRKSDKAWQVTTRLMTDSYSTSINAADLVGCMTRFIGKILLM